MEVRRGLVAVLLIVAGVAAVGGGWFAARSLNLDQGTVEPADLFAQLELPAIDGGTDGPAQRLGEVVVLDFWASWCSPCHVQGRLLAQLQERYANADVQFFAVNVGEPESLVRSSLKQHPIASKVLLDADAKWSSRADVFGLPTVVVLGRDGALALRRTGLTSINALRKVIDQALAGEQTLGG